MDAMIYEARLYVGNMLLSTFKSEEEHRWVKPNYVCKAKIKPLYIK